MAIEYSTATISYVGNGSATTFDFDFPVRESKHIEVKLLSPEFVSTALTEGSDYSILPKGGSFPTDTGGTVTYPISSSGLEPLPDGWSITINRIVPYTQPDVYPDNSALNPKIIEGSLDNLEMQIQQINDGVNKAVKVPDGSQFDNDEFVARIFEAEKNAKASEGKAKQSETNAKASEGKAKQSETNAKASELSAGQYAQTATTKAQEAEASATSAGQYAQTATTKASEASTSETNAKASEGKAKQSETLAKQYADEAKESASGIGNPVSFITVQDATLTVGKANGETEAVTIDNVEHAKVAETLAGFTELLEMLNPIGKIWTSTNPTNPHDILGFGTWEAIQAGRVLIAQGTSSWGATYNAGSMGGEATHTLNINETPSHGHTGYTDTVGNHQHEVPKNQGMGSNVALSQDSIMTISNNPVSSRLYTWGTGSHAHSLIINATGGNQPHNNMQPYLAVYMWQRTA